MMGDGEGVWYLVVQKDASGQKIATTGFSDDADLTDVRAEYGAAMFSIWQFDDSDAQMEFIAEFQKAQKPPLVAPVGSKRVTGGMPTTTKVAIGAVVLAGIYLLTR